MQPVSCRWASPSPHLVLKRGSHREAEDDGLKNCVPHVGPLFSRFNPARSASRNGTPRSWPPGRVRCPHHVSPVDGAKTSRRMWPEAPRVQPVFDRQATMIACMRVQRVRLRPSPPKGVVQRPCLALGVGLCIRMQGGARRGPQGGTTHADRAPEAGQTRERTGRGRRTGPRGPSRASSPTSRPAATPHSAI